MSPKANLQRLMLDELARRCARETEAFFQGKRCDSRYGFELFRRAIVERDERAWHLLYAQYDALVAGWVQRHPLLSASGEDASYFVNRAFERMWLALSPEKFARFDDLKSVLRYLQMCVHSVIVDHVRREDRDIDEIQEETRSSDGDAVESTLESQVFDRMVNEQFWQLVHTRLRDDREWLVIYGSFVLGLKPREMLGQYDHLFNDVSEVYRVKQNVLTRLRRDRQMVQLVAESA